MDRMDTLDGPQPVTQQEKPEMVLITGISGLQKLTSDPGGKSRIWRCA
jgi:hypothetical protein